MQRTRKSPFYQATRRAGATGFTVYNHMLMPTWYESPEADYWQLVTNVTVWDVACERQVQIRGPDAFQLIRMMTPRNLSKLGVGQCRYVPLVGPDGGMINDPVLLRLGADHFWLSLADSDVLLWAKGLAQGLGMDVDIDEPDVSPLGIQGPNAEPVAATLLGDWVAQLRYFHFREYELGEIPLIVARSGWSKQGGFELYLRDGQFGRELWDRVMQAGEAFEIAPATPSNIERIESGLLSYGNDMTLQNNPFEIGLGKYCDLEQAFEFIGKRALRRILREGVTRKLVGLVLHTSTPLSNQEHWPISAEGIPAGHVTSATYSPRLKQNIAFGIVSVASSAIGTRLQVDTPLGSVPATVHAMPFL